MTNRVIINAQVSRACRSADRQSERKGGEGDRRFGGLWWREASCIACSSRNTMIARPDRPKVAGIRVDEARSVATPFRFDLQEGVSP